MEIMSVTSPRALGLSQAHADSPIHSLFMLKSLVSDKRQKGIAKSTQDTHTHTYAFAYNKC